MRMGSGEPCRAWCWMLGLCLVALMVAIAPDTVFADSNAGAADAGAASDEEVIREDPGPLTERLADLTSALAEDAVVELKTALQALDPRGREIDWPAISAAALDFGLVAVPTLLLLALLRWLEGYLLARLQSWCALASAFERLTRRCIACVARIVADFTGILIAWVGGYALALFVVGESGEMDSSQSLFLNAFLGLELVKAGFRLLLAPGHAGLRVLPLGDEDAVYWNTWLVRLVTYVGYGLLLIAPLVSQMIAPELGSVVAFVVLATGLCYGVAIIRQNRDSVRHRLQALAEASTASFNRFAMGLLARIWHGLAIAYLTVLAGVILLRPEDALAIMGEATLQTLIVAGVGLALYYALNQALGRRLRMPEATRARLPDLEERLNQFLAPGIHVLRVLVMGLIALGLADAWHLMDVPAWGASESGMRLLAQVVSVFLIVVFASAFWIVTASWIDANLRLEDDGGRDIGPRKRTLLSLFRNALAIVVAVVTGMVLLSEIGVNIAPLLAGAGVVGLAVGFGAQKLVQDVITGVFIQIENAMNTGDWVTAGGLSGTVERLSIRSVGIRDLEGTFHIIPFSSVDTVSNYMRDFAYHLGVYRVAYRENTDEAIEYLRHAFADLEQDPNVAPYMLSDLNVDGVSALDDSSVNIRIRIKTVAGMQWFVGRAYNRLVKQHFDAAGLEIPFPHQKMYFGTGVEGDQQPLAVRMINDEGPAENGRAAGAAVDHETPRPGTDPVHEGGDELPAEFGDIKRTEDPRKAPDDDSEAAGGEEHDDERQ